MQVQVISFHCVLKNKLGHVLGESFNQDVLTADESPDAPLRGLTQGLQNMQQGEKRKIFVPAQQAYGYYDPEQVLKISLDAFTKAPKVGEVIQYPQLQKPLRVTEIHDGVVTLDANHPLAGQDLIFEVEVFDARPATAEDLDSQIDNSNQANFH